MELTLAQINARLAELEIQQSCFQTLMVTATPEQVEIMQRQAKRMQVEIVGLAIMRATKEMKLKELEEESIASLREMVAAERI